jgi:hypothetical protein
VKEAINIYETRFLFFEVEKLLENKLEVVLGR